MTTAAIDETPLSPDELQGDGLQRIFGRSAPPSPPFDNDPGFIAEWQPAHS